MRGKSALMSGKVGVGRSRALLTRITLDCVHMRLHPTFATTLVSAHGGPPRGYGFGGGEASDRRGRLTFSIRMTRPAIGTPCASRYTNGSPRIRWPSSVRAAAVIRPDTSPSDMSPPEMSLCAGGGW